MKRLINLLLLLACVSTAHAADETVINYAKGPVKLIIVAKNYEKYNNVLSNFKVRRQIYMYDTQGRLKEELHYDDDKLQLRYVYQYSDNICMQYKYGQKKIIKGNYSRSRMDSTGNIITSETYIDGKFFSADSTVYDESGRKIEYYTNIERERNITLKYTYEYDPLGRLSKIRDILHGGFDICSVEYQPNGNFTEYHSDKKGTKWEYHYFVNDQGLLVEVQWRESERTLYSNFDQYGNWLESERIYPEEGTVVTKRVIEYYD